MQNNDFFETSPSASFAGSSLWLYFTSRNLRNVCYLGISSKILFNIITKRSIGTGNWSRLILASVFGLSAFLNIKIPNLFSSNPKQESFWSTSAQDSQSLMGTWFLGCGNGEWFGIIGHNGVEETTILPSIVLEQMSLKRQTGDVGHVDPEVKISEMDHDVDGKDDPEPEIEPNP